MEHSVQSYLKRRTTEELKEVLIWYKEQEETDNTQAIKLILQELKNRQEANSILPQKHIK